MAREDIGDICLVKPAAPAVYNIISTSAGPPTPVPLLNFWNVIEEWGETWMWENLSICGEVTWLAAAIAENRLIAVTDGSCMKDVYPQVNSAAFVFECTDRQGRLWGFFVEHSPNAGSYRGELLGLMAIHLILRGINTISTNLGGLVLILSNCLGALNKVKDLPPYRIPTKCSHSDILKKIMVNCSNLTFSRIYIHVKAHQDDGKTYGTLMRDAQLNCQMDYLAKRAIHDAQDPQEAPTRRFPLELICVFLGRNKLTLDNGDRLQFWVHKQLAQSRFHHANILFADQFNTVDWEVIYSALRRVPRMFQIWACKQIMNIAPANGNRPWERSLSPLCPSCMQVPETCSHILFCNHSGTADVAEWLDQRLK
jgi:hypothetical protein